MSFTQAFLSKIYRLGFLLVLILILFDLLTYFYYPDSVLADIFLATREQTPLTWISALTFLLLALSCFSVYQRERRAVWYALSAIFFFFSMDDATFFHERFSGFVVDNTTIFSGFPSYIWVVLYAPLLFIALGSLLYVLWQDATWSNRKMIVLAVFLLGSAVVLDLLDGLMQKDAQFIFCLETQCNQMLTHVMRLSEEVLEVFSLGILGYLHIQKYNLIDKIIK